MYAVIETGGKQYRVAPGGVIAVERLPGSGRDIDAGLDRLLGEAERLLPSGFRDGARNLVASMSSGHNDDCALVLVWRP